MALLRSLLQHVTPRKFGSQPQAGQITQTIAPIRDPARRAPNRPLSGRTCGTLHTAVVRLLLVNRLNLIVPSNDIDYAAKELHPKGNKFTHRSQLLGQR